MSATEPPPAPNTNKTITTMLKIENLHASIAGKEILKGLSLEVKPGEVHAIMGPNGAGKSTLFQLLTGLFAPDAGEVEIDGLSLRRSTRQALARIGVVFQQMSLDLDLSVRRNLQFHTQLHGLPAALARQRIEEAAETFGLAKDLPRAVRELSGGNRRKVELARALLHRPALLLMDEPTVGLDPKSRRDLLAAIRADVAARDSTVLWATHLVEEAQAADRVLVLHKGVLLADGTPEAVTQQLGGGTLEEAFVKATA